MNTLTTALRTATFAALAALMATPADAAPRANLFGRSSRSFMGMGDSGTGEFFSVTPGARSFRAHLRNARSMGYAGGGQRFTLRFGNNNPRSIRGLNGRMNFSSLRGGGMRVFVQSLRGARVGRPMTIFPGAGALAERGSPSAATSFRFTGFDQFGFTREQLLNDVPLFGQALARLIDSGFGSVNVLFQRLAAELLLQPPGTFGSLGSNSIVDVFNGAAGGILSGFTNSGDAQQILSSEFDLVAFLDPFLRGIDLNGDGSINFSDRRLLVRFEKFIRDNEETILELLNDFGLLTFLQQSVDSRSSASYMPVDPGSPGTVQFAASSVAVLENAGTTFVYVTREGGSLGEVTASVVLGGSSTADPSAFRFVGQTVKWRDGEYGPKAVNVKILDDRLVEGDSAIVLNISGLTGGASSGGQDTTQINIVDNDSPQGASALAVARNSTLVVEYSWSRNQRDLDTYTTFLGNSVGYRGDDLGLFAPYLAWSGDDRAVGGKEVVVVDIDSAIADGALISITSLDCAADWYHFTGSLGNDVGSTGPATLTVYFRDKITGRTSPKAILPNGIFPNTYNTFDADDHATTQVAFIDLNYDSFSGVIEFDVATN